MCETIGNAPHSLTLSPPTWPSLSRCLSVYISISLAQSGQRPILSQKQPASRRANNKSQARKAIDWNYRTIEIIASILRS